MQGGRVIMKKIFLVNIMLAAVSCMLIPLSINAANNNISINIGEKYRLITNGKKYKFKSGKPKVVKVTKKGVVRGLKKGKCVVRILKKDGGLFKKYKITVVNKTKNPSKDIQPPSVLSSAAPVQTAAPGGYKVLFKGNITNVEKLSDKEARYTIKNDTKYYICDTELYNNKDIGSVVVILVDFGFDINKCQTIDEATTYLGKIYGFGG